MSIFKKKTVFWYLAYLLGIMFAIWAYRISLRNGAVSLHQFYETELHEFIIIALVLPIFSVIILKKVMDYMNYSKMLNMGSRCKWQRKLMKELIKAAMKYAFIILAPMSIVAFIFSESVRNSTEVVYCMFSYIMYATVLIIMATVIMEIKMRWNIDVAAVLSVLVIAFIPYIITKVFIRNQVITFSELINSTYLFEDDKYLWLMHEAACVAALIVLGVVYKIAKSQIKKKDFLWRQSGNEN